MKPSVVLYTRAGCHLCDDAKAVLEKAMRSAAFHLSVVDIDRDPDALKLYNEEVPVIAINGVKAFKYRVTIDDFLERLTRRT